MSLVFSAVTWSLVLHLLLTGVESSGSEDQMYIIVTDDNGNIIEQRKVGSDEQIFMKFPSRSNNLKVRTTNHESIGSDQSSDLPTPRIIDDFGNDVKFADRNLVCSSLHPFDCSDVNKLSEYTAYIPILPIEMDTGYFYSNYRRNMEKHRNVRELKALSRQFIDPNNDISDIRTMNVYNAPIYDSRNAYEPLTIFLNETPLPKSHSLLKMRRNVTPNQSKYGKSKATVDNKSSDIFASFRRNVSRGVSATHQSFLKTGITYKRPMLKTHRLDNPFVLNTLPVNAYRVPNNKREAMKMRHNALKLEKKEPSQPYIPYITAAAYELISEAHNKSKS